MPVPNEAMKEEAQRGLDWRREFGRGGTEIGIARARDIVNGRDLSQETVRRMKAYFDRHEIDKEAEGFRPGEDGYPSNGRIAWALWGGDAGRSWANANIENDQDERFGRETRPYPGEHAARLRDPDLFDRFVRENDQGGEGIDFILGINEEGSEIQSIRFDSGLFTVEEAKKWLDEHDFVPILFEPALPVDDRARDVIHSPSEVDMSDKEIRSGVPVEVRANEAGDIMVAGYAAVFGQETNIGGMFMESIERGAFKDAIGRDDVVFLINHEGLPLARTRSGTMTLSEDDHGLYMEARLDPRDPDVRSIVPKMKRGDLDKMSFAFIPETQEWDESGDMPRRTIKRVSLYDVSIVTTPAYDGTEIGLRSLEAHRKAKRAANFSAARKRMEMKARYHGLTRENG
jgi:HK97 family phage prohead protease